ncbi:large subunit ribosomal protein L32e [Nematocida sp. AWRm80]|nr:large subunit ribosomal protein L32e [Nematocida sp. AWRm80]
MADLLKTTPVVKFIKVKKTTREFNRFQSDQFKRLSKSWRRPKGIDNRVRKGIRGVMTMPKIGFKGDKLVRFILPNGFRKVLINNVKDLEALISLNRVYCGEIAKTVGAKKRVEIVKRAADLGIVLTNGEAKLTLEKLD